MHDDQFSVKSKSSLRFVIQSLISFIVLGFCISQVVIKSTDNKDIALWWGGITSVFAYWMESPVSSNNRKEEHNTLLGNNTIEASGSGSNPPEPLPPSVTITATEDGKTTSTVVENESAEPALEADLNNQNWK